MRAASKTSGQSRFRNRVEKEVYLVWLMREGQKREPSREAKAETGGRKMDGSGTGQRKRVNKDTSGGRKAENQVLPRIPVSGVK